MSLYPCIEVVLSEKFPLQQNLRRCNMRKVLLEEGEEEEEEEEERNRKKGGREGGGANQWGTEWWYLGKCSYQLHEECILSWLHCWRDLIRCIIQCISSTSCTLGRQDRNTHMTTVIIHYWPPLTWDHLCKYIPHPLMRLPPLVLSQQDEGKTSVSPCKRC